LVKVSKEKTPLFKAFTSADEWSRTTDQGLMSLSQVTSILVAIWRSVLVVKSSIVRGVIAIKASGCDPERFFFRPQILHTTGCQGRAEIFSAKRLEKISARSFYP